MFVFKKDHRFQWPVDVDIPQDGGRIGRQRFTAVFETIPSDQMEAHLRLPMFEQDRAIATACLVGWGADVTDEKKKPIPYSAKRRDELLAIPYVRRAVVLAYMAATAGKAAEKN